MKLRHRLMFVVFGGVIGLYGLVELHAGHFVWQNWRGYHVFGSGIVAMGIAIALLSLLPPYRHGRKQ